MIKILLLCASLLLFPFLALAEHEKKSEYPTLFATMLSTTAVQCAPSDKSKNVFKPVGDVTLISPFNFPEIKSIPAK